ncbi:MAG: hypothetical protein R3D02_02295 [Hyphomicrobiales bacterium]
MRSGMPRSASSRLIVDLATLTGAIMVPCGHHHAGLFLTTTSPPRSRWPATRHRREAVTTAPIGKGLRQADRSRFADAENTGGRAGPALDHRRPVPQALHQGRRPGLYRHRRGGGTKTRNSAKGLGQYGECLPTLSSAGTNYGNDEGELGRRGDLGRS